MTAVKGNTSVSYRYGADGLRTQKTVGSTVYDYYYADGLLVRQTWGTNYMDFLSFVLERAFNTHKYSADGSAMPLTSTCCVVCLLSQVIF